MRVDLPAPFSPQIALDREVDVREGLHAGERLRDAAHLENVVGHPCSCSIAGAPSGATDAAAGT
jgi:hypothetical protein